MARFVVRRLLFAVVLVAVSSSAALLLTRLGPGDVTIQLDRASEAEKAATRAKFDLDRGPFEQWALWAGRAIRFDLGDSFLYGRPVAPLVRRAAAHTAALGLIALVVATVLGISLGIFTGIRQQGTAVAIVRAMSVAFVSVPPLLTSLLLAFVAARTGWLPIGGLGSAAAIGQGWGAWIADVAWYLPLPVLALSLPLAATLERLQSQAIGAAAHQPFLTAAKARGVPYRALVLRHAWRVSLRPVCAVYGLVNGALLSGSFVVEYVTAWPGLGRLMVDALRARDIYLVAGCAAMGSLLLAAGTLAGDLLLAAADPRVRESEVR